MFETIPRPSPEAATRMTDMKKIRDDAVKAGHLVLRQFGQAPEMRAARRLAATMPEPSSKGDGPRVLILSMRDWAVHVQIEALLGHALELRGAEVSYLTCGGGREICDRVNSWEGPPVPCGSCSKYVGEALEAHGRTPVSLSDRSGSSMWPELDTMSLPELRDVECYGLPLGRLVEVPVKWFLLADNLALDPIGPTTYRMFLREARRILRQLELALDERAPDSVLMLNGLFLFESLARELCQRRGIRVATYERGFIIDTFLFDGQQPVGFMDLSQTWPEWRGRDLDVEADEALDHYLEDRRHGRRTVDEYWRNVSFGGIEQFEGGTRAVLFTNLVWDSAVVGQDIAFRSIVDWIGCSVRLFARRPQDELIIRIHPAEVKLPGRESRERMLDALQRLEPNLPPNVRVVEAEDPTSSYVLMEHADVGLVYSSTTGLEMVLAGKPVVVAAQTHYRDKGFTIDVNTPEEYSQVVDDVLDDPGRFAPDQTLARKYASLFFFSSTYEELGVHEHVRGLVELTVSDAADLMPGASPDLDAFCDAFLGDFDFGRRP